MNMIKGHENPYLLYEYEVSRYYFKTFYEKIFESKRYIHCSFLTQTFYSKLLLTIRQYQISLTNITIIISHKLVYRQISNSHL